MQRTNFGYNRSRARGFRSSWARGQRRGVNMNSCNGFEAAQERRNREHEENMIKRDDFIRSCIKVNQKAKPLSLVSDSQSKLEFVFIKPILPDMDSKFALDETRVNQLDCENQAYFEAKLDFCRYYNIKFEIGKFFSITRYAMKFKVDFTFDELNESMFYSFMCKVQDAMHKDQIKMEFSPSAITFLSKKFELSTLLHPEYHMKFEEFAIGSLINLGHFSSHLHQFYDQIFKPDEIISNNNNTLKIKFDNNKLAIEFNIDSNRFKLDMSLMIIQRMVLQMPKTNDEAYHLYFQVTSSPILVYAEQGEWQRTNNFDQRGSHEASDPKLLGMARAYFLKVPFENVMKKNEIYQNLLYMAQKCKENNKTFTFHISEVAQTMSNRWYEQTLEEVHEMFLDRFNILYASLVLFSKSYTVADQLDLEEGGSSFHNHKGVKNFLKLVDQYSREDDVSVLEECLYSLELQCRDEIVNVRCEFLSLMYDRLKFQRRNITKNKACQTLVRRAVLTPSHLYFERPTPLMKSRFSKISKADYALRITVLEDNFLRFNKNLSPKGEKFLRDNIEDPLLNGIKIGNRTYHFLGSSSSQMKDNGMILYAQDNEEHDSQWIRFKAGDFSNFNNNRAKFVARLGLIFSQAIAQVNLVQHCVKRYVTKDIEGALKPIFNDTEYYDNRRIYQETKRERYNFSDGAGVITEELANIIIEQLSITGGYKPCAFQIRYGGCKGMLTIFPGVEGKAIIFRDSMIKFASPDEHLGILKYSYPRSVFLNRPLIMILDQLDVKPEIFYRFFAQNTAKIAKAFLNQFEALSLIMTYRNEHLPYIKLFRNGINLLQEPFFRRILCYLADYRLNELKLKARIKVPESNGRMAFGVVDETMSLNYGEIFFQYTEMDEEGRPTDKVIILEGEVMVTKFPCLQPGDVRKLKAVDIYKLHHIKDCVVFPGKGERPHPDEMGGSDLDGDEYAIFWNSKLIFPRENQVSMIFPSGKTEVLDHQLKMSDVISFYIEYMINNNMGQVANSHLMYSDFHPAGLFSDECHKLAIKYSIALDYQKTGYNCGLSSQFLFTQKSLRPDFMTRPSFRVYLSKRILGQFYRQCCLIEEVLKLADSLLNIANKHYSKPTAKFVLSGWKRYKLEAQEAYMEYRSRVVEIMEQLNLDGETMLLSDVYEDRSDMATILLANLLADFQAKFDSQAANLDLSQRALLASAWYSICFEPDYMMKYQYKNQPLLGLPWTITNEIIAILTHQNLNMFDFEENDTLMQDEWVKLDSLDSNYSLDQFTERECTVLLTTIKLAMTWITRINYLYERDFEVIYLTNRARTRRHNEDDYMQKLVENCLVKLCSIKKSQISSVKSDRGLVCFLFNQFMLYLFSLCNSIDESIFTGNLSELLLIRYGVFALGFVNQIDKLFVSDQVASGSLLEWSKEQFDLLFDKFLLNAHSIKERVTEVFYLLQPNTKLDLDALTMDESKAGEFFQKLSFLTGVDKLHVDFEPFDWANLRFHTVFHGGNNKSPLPVECTHKIGEAKKRLRDRPNDVYFKVVTHGLPVSTRLVRVLLGHPEFCDQIYTKFQLSKTV